MEEIKNKMELNKLPIYMMYQCRFCGAETKHIKHDTKPEVWICLGCGMIKVIYDEVKDVRR